MTFFFEKLPCNFGYTHTIVYKNTVQYMQEEIKIETAVCDKSTTSIYANPDFYENN